jgi:hypothetical protein
MTGGEKLLARMRANPRDWRIDNVLAVCRAVGVECTAPRKGSYNKVKHVSMTEILTIPAHRPIKPVYIKALVGFLDAVRKAEE